MRLFLNESRRLDSREIRRRAIFTRAAVWAEDGDLQKMLKDLDD